MKELMVSGYIYQMAECTKPVDRLWISSLTYSAIKSGFENLKSGSEYDDLYQSARCRAEADWLIGINGSRAFAVANEMYGLSVGRVLSPTLAILVDRELERRNFISEEYCELVVSYDGWEGKMINPDREADPERWPHFMDDRKAELKRFAEGDHTKATVAFAESMEEIIPPLLLYDLTSLQRDANRLYNYSSKYTLDMAQRLYEKKATTYPRTDSRYLSSDIKSTLNKRLESLCTEDWAEHARQAMKSDRDLFGRFILDKGVSDHHAIIPTGEAKDMENWSKGEQNIYDLIVRRFIGMFLPDKKVKRQTVKTSIGDAVFLSRGEKIMVSGWSAVDQSRQAEVQELPEVAAGDIVPVKGMRVRTDETKPPAPHTEASLLNAMEHAGKIIGDETEESHETEFGIGTPATRAATIDKLIEKQMVIRKGRALIPTEYGMKLIGILPDFLRSPEMTGDWEARLSRISKGNADPDEFMDDIRELTKEVVEYAAERGDQGLKDASVVGVCPLCGQKVREYPEAYYCENKECDFRRIWKVKKGSHPTLKREAMEQLLKTGKAKADTGNYTLLKDEPYIAFERTEKPKPEYDSLLRLISDYGLEPVNKVPKGGSLWFEGAWKDEKMNDFASDCSDIGCPLQFSKDAKALKHKSGWFLTVDPAYMEEFCRVFNVKCPAKTEPPVIPAEGEDLILNLVKGAGFEYVDKREKGGALWIIAGEEEAKEFAEECKSKEIEWHFSQKGSKATGHKPGWYCK